MPSSNYRFDYRPFDAIRRRHYVWAFFAVLSLVAIIDAFISRSMRALPSLLDQYQPLKTTHDTSITDYGLDSNSSSLKIPSPEERAVVTTLFSESYMAAVLTLGYSLEMAEISARRVLLYFPERISPRTVCWLRTNGWELRPIERIAPPSGGRNVFHRFVDNYSKLQIWTLDKIGIKRVIYLDADMLVRRNFDELWALPFQFAAVPDVYGNRKGFALTFNAGMMFLRTSSAVFEDLLSKIDSDAYEHGEAEQGLLNTYFASQVVRLPYIYNANLMIKQRSPILWQAMEKDTRVVHYTILKPFIDRERQQARAGIWEPEMKLWDLAWHEAFLKILQDKCSSK